MTVRGLGDNRATHRCAPAHCGRCSAPVLDGRADGARARVDPWPITIAADRLYRIARRVTFDLARGELQWRDPSKIAHTTESNVILIEHRCGHPPHGRHLRALPPIAPRPSLHDGEFPF